MAVRHIPPGVALHPLAVPVTRRIFAVTRRSGTRHPAVRVVLDELLADTVAPRITGVLARVRP